MIKKVEFDTIIGIESSDDLVIWGYDSALKNGVKEIHISRNDIRTENEIFIKNINNKDFKSTTWAPLQCGKRKSYVVCGNWIVSNQGLGNTISVLEYSWEKVFKFEYEYFLSNLFHLSFKNLFIILVRPFYRLINLIVRNGKQIILISDRIDKAGDNGEVLYKYLNDKHTDEFRSFFVIRNNEDDRNRLKKYGKVIKYGGFVHKLLLWGSPIIATSQPADTLIGFI